MLAYMRVFVSHATEEEQEREREGKGKVSLRTEDGFGKWKQHLAIGAMKGVCDFASELQMLCLVFAHWHLRSTV